MRPNLGILKNFVFLYRARCRVKFSETTCCAARPAVFSSEWMKNRRMKDFIHGTEDYYITALQRFVRFLWPSSSFRCVMRIRRTGFVAVVFFMELCAMLWRSSQSCFFSCGAFRLFCFCSFYSWILEALALIIWAISLLKSLVFWILCSPVRFLLASISRRFFSFPGLMFCGYADFDIYSNAVWILE